MGFDEPVIHVPSSSLKGIGCAEQEVVQDTVNVSTTSALACRWEIAFVGAALLVVCGHLLIKAGLNSVPVVAAVGLPARLSSILTQPTVLLGLGIYGLGTLCWMAAVAQADLSLLYPLTSLNYVLIALLSYLVFGERISIARGSGIALIALGMILLTRSRRQKEN